MTRWIGLALLAVLLLAVPAAAQPIAGSRSHDQRIADLASYWRRSPSTPGHQAATASMFLALGLLAFAAGGTLADIKKSRSSRALLLDVAAILVWSSFVRFVLTEPNILTDGGSGYTRLMRYRDGYGGVAVLVQLLPAEWSSFMWRAMLVPRLLAALSPALLVMAARGLGLSRADGLIAGLVLASLPVHAALTTSDLLVGPLSSLQLGGLALVLFGCRRQRLDLFAAGVAVAVWAMWVRPEGVLGLLPIAAACLFFPRPWWRSPVMWAVFLGAAAMVAANAVSLATADDTSPSFSFGSIENIAWERLTATTIILPLWLWAPAPLGLLALRRFPPFAVTIAGLVAGLIPVYLRGLGPDPADTNLEAVRYALPALAWLALLSAVGLDTLCRWLAVVAPADIRRRLLFGLRTVVALVAASPVAFHHDYLARRYGHAASEAAIRQLLRQVPEGCGLLAPDDLAEGVSIEIYDRYAFIAAEAFALGETPQIEVRPVSDLLDGKIDLDGCWTFIRGPYCYHAFNDPPAKACERLGRRFQLEEIDSIPIEFRHHRLVTGPDVRRGPWYLENMSIGLYRVLPSSLEQ